MPGVRESDRHEHRHVIEPPHRYKILYRKLTGTSFGVALSLFLCSCNPNDPPGVQWYDELLLAEPGNVYEVTFDTAVDSLAVQTEYVGRDQLLLTPLHDLAAKAIIIKADDLRGRVTGKWKRYFQLVEGYGIHHSAGLICQSLASVDKLNRAYLSFLLRKRCELWLHGWNHFLSDSRAEFQGSSYQQQYDHLRMSVDIVQEQLGYTMHTFGAPGNRLDDNTTLALNAIPEIKVWLAGKEDGGLFDIPIAWVTEYPPGTLRPPEQFLSRFDMFRERDAILLQLHPNAYDDAEFGYLSTVLDSLTSLDSRIFMTPYQYYIRVTDRDVISVFKIDETKYRLNFTAAKFGHLVEFDQPYTLSIH